MKVKDLIKKINLCSDVEIRISAGVTSNGIRLSYQELREASCPFDSATVNSISVEKDRLTIYVKE